MRPSANRSVVLAVFGMLLIFLGALLCIFWPVLIHRLVNKELSLSPTSQSFEIWSDSSKIPLHMEIYFFNWTNPHELKIPGKKPNFVQLGPYTFLERREKVNVTFHPRNSTVSYDQRRYWYYEESRSNGSLKDNVTQLNVVALSATHKIRDWSYILQVSMSAVAMSKINDIHITKTVDELLFSGYSDTLIDMGQLGGHMIDIPPFDKFGWFYQRNGSTEFDGHFNVDTGADDIMNIGLLRQWNYRNVSKFYSPPCNALEGSAGEFWSPKRTKDEISLFSADICRPLFYEYEGISRHHGIEGYKYGIGEKTLSNSTKRRYPHEQAKYFETRTSTEEEFFDIEHSREMSEVTEDYGDDPDVVDIGQCFCNGECLPSGLLNVTACRYGAPAFLSLPHFHKADPVYRQVVEGMDPVDEKHGFSITLEPETGIPINVAARLQVNILLQPSQYISLYKDVPRIYFPMFWFSEQVGITEDLAFSLKIFLLLPSIGFYSSIALIGFGVLIMIVAGFLRYSRKRRNTASNIRQQGGIVHPGQKTELVYLDTAIPNDDNQTRLNRQLYPKLIGDKQNL